MSIHTTAVNEMLHEFYTSIWRKLCDMKRSDVCHSNPLLIEVSDNYCHSQTRVLAVGQQTSTWQNNTDDLEELLRHYKKFLADCGNDRSHTPFWRAIKNLNVKINGDGPIRVLWSNLLKMDCCGKRPKLIEEDLCELRMLEVEIRILKPNVAVFFTGPGYDERLNKALPDIEYHKVNNFDQRVLARLSHSGLPRASFRTCHPKYLQMKKMIEPVLFAISNSTNF
jgi:hypothetical protein